MKIAILLLSGGVVERGAETAMHLLAEDLAKLGQQATVFQNGKEVRSRDRDSEHDVVFISLPTVPKSHKPTTVIGKVLERCGLNTRGLLTLLFSLKVMPKLLRGNYDIAIPVDGVWEILACRVVRLIKQTKIVLVGMAGIGWTDAQNINLSPDAFVALSPQAQSWAEQLQPNLLVKTIPLQVDLKTYSPKGNRAKAPLQSPIILTVAALTAYKRIDLIIRAVSQLQRGSLLVIGQPGEEEENLRTLAQKLLPGRHAFMQVPHKRMPEYYRASNVFALTSEPQEAFGKVIVEAMACGLPVVTTDDPLRRWIVGEQGIFVDPNNTQSFSQALEQAAHVSKPIHYQNVQRFHRASVAKEYAALFDTLKEEYAK